MLLYPTIVVGARVMIRCFASLAMLIFVVVVGYCSYCTVQYIVARGIRRIARFTVPSETWPRQRNKSMLQYEQDCEL